jgi:hypothetical protein
MEPRYRILLGGLAAFALAGFISVAQVSAVPDEEPGACPDAESLELPKSGHVTLCHFTGSGHIINAPSENALNTHASHHGDCWKTSTGATGCAP